MIYDMRNSRRNFIKYTALTGIGLAGWNILKANASRQFNQNQINKAKLDFAIATLGDGSVLSTPFWRVDSKKEGPALLLIAANHGNEVQGVEVARRFKQICENNLVAGSVWLVPMAHILAIRTRQYSPNLRPGEPIGFSKDHNIERTWPGDPEGNDTERVAYALEQAVLRHCSHAVDIHCWNHFWAAETLLYDDHIPSQPLGKVTTTRFISKHKALPHPSGKMQAAQLIRKRGGGCIVIELSGQYQMQERQVQIGLSSMVNIAKKLGMIKGEPQLIERPRVERNRETSYTVNAPCAGIFMPAIRSSDNRMLMPEDYVEEGQPLGHIIRESDLATIPLAAPVSGYLWQYGMCHFLPGGVRCDVSLPAQHPYADGGETIALIVKV